MITHGPIDLIENEEVKRHANLSLPMLFTLFEDTQYRPKTMVEAKNYFHLSFTKMKLVKRRKFINEKNSHLFIIFYIYQ
ncbi:hypothetical protein KHA80_06070 [Anaerobacillus sp. HL2]|nr:hypothetical protein KHA80_06070 [Anaerobacillus sp. HL2]